MRGGIIAAAAAALLLGGLLGGCASPSLVLLNDEGGGHGAVAVLESRGKPIEQVVNIPDSRTRLGGARPMTRGLASGLNADERALIAFLPPPPVSFIVNFNEGTTTLAPGADSVIDAIRAEVAHRQGAEIQVTGHTDTLGSDDANDALSEKRADEIVKALIVMGFDPALMSAVGRGERAPLVKTGDGVANASNRRVEIIIR